VYHQFEYSPFSSRKKEKEKKRINIKVKCNSVQLMCKVQVVVMA